MNYIELSKQVGAVQNVLAMGRHDGVLFTETELEKFAELVAAQEREECAALCFSIWNEWLDTPEEDRYKVLYDAEDCATAIRARGTT